MSDSIDWFSLVKDAQKGDNTPKCGELPTNLTTPSCDVGSAKPSNKAAYSDISPNSPHSPQKKQGIGKDDNLDTGAGVLDGKFFCDINRGVGALVNLQIAPDKGMDCQGCKHLNMLQFVRPKDRRLFHWRCAQGFNILEAGCNGERVLIAPAECKSFQGTF